MIAYGHPFLVSRTELRKLLSASVRNTTIIAMMTKIADSDVLPPAKLNKANDRGTHAIAEQRILRVRSDFLIPVCSPSFIMLSIRS